MRTIPAGEFKAKCLALMDEVESTGEVIVVTKRGKPVVRIGPAKIARKHQTQENDIFGFMHSQGAHAGDIVGPIIPAEEWSHLQIVDEGEESV
ncbi:type II toxin-antitoxin system Phd/YefM family antitoxin [Acidicapsa dinghuensis]|uniref:Antitoxin n=1 Tax=Acidicapsa dinghuensis TaxID=2218256 RepID=A0ABW1E9C5_9BACT|nr:type II toxin-antitoxin system Phd/YefM family antitoxin [Acidicapsa dinghuensis]